MTHYRLPRTGEVDLEFDGEILVEETSQETGKVRWTEVRIYTTNTGKWVTEVTGRSAATGESTRSKVTVCTTPQAVVDSLRLWSDRHHKYVLTNICLDALDAAAEADHQFLPVTREKI